MTLTKSSYPSSNVGVITTTLSLSCHMSFHNLHSFLPKRGLLSSECNVNNDLDKLHSVFHLFLDEEDSHSSLQEVITTPQISSLTTRSVCARNDKSCDNKKASGDNIREECEISNGAVCQHYP